MAVTSTPIYPQTHVTSVITIANADGTNKKTIYTGGTNGSLVENISITNTDTSAYTLNIYVTSGGTDYLMGTINIPLSSGNTTSAASLNLLAQSNFTPLNTDAFGNKYLYLANGAVLKGALTGTITSPKLITFIAQGVDF